jgi:hypothetical protein
MLTPDMKRIIEEQRLGFVATASLDGTPNVSPKGTFAVLDDLTIAFGEIRSPGTIRNLKANPRIEVNFVDAFVRKGYRPQRQDAFPRARSRRLRSRMLHEFASRPVRGHGTDFPKSYAKRHRGRVSGDFGEAGSRP